MKRVREKAVARAPEASILGASWLREITLASAADDVGFVGVQGEKSTRPSAEIAPTGRFASERDESRTPLDCRARVSDSESASMWQSLSFGANYKAS